MLKMWVKLLKCKDSKFRSKKLYTWKLKIDDTDHTILLYNSLLSGKKKIIHNKKTVMETVKYYFNLDWSDFPIPFK